MSSNKYRCNWCLKEGNLKSCTQCQLVDYCGVECQTNDWKKGGHKILCRKLPKAVKEAKVKINSFTLNDYNTRDVGSFMSTEAECVRGQILEEGKAQDLCYDAMDLEEGSSTKVLKILEALKCFPLSVEAWGMLGRFYRWEYKSYEFRTKECSAEALKMYDISIACARKLNPTWTETRNNELPWGEIDNRPYLRSLCGRALALKDTGEKNDAIRQAKKLIRLNPTDNQGVRKLLCSWYLEVNDTEGCTNLLRKYGTSHDTNLAYSDVLLQFLRWNKDDVIEDDVKKALYFAIKSNCYVSDLIIAKEKKQVNHKYISQGGMTDAETYTSESRRLWRKNSDSINWLESQKNDGVKVPSEMDLIKLLKSGVTFQIICSHTDLDGHDRSVSTLVGTQRRSKCLGWGCEDFFWPRQLKYKHQNSADIFMHDNSNNREHDMSSWKCWRKTKYKDVIDVPFWKILLQFYEEDPDNDEKNENELVSSINSNPSKSHKKSIQKRNIKPLNCEECGSPGRFCALGNDGVSFYCSESCMNDKLIESGLDPEPLYVDLNSTTMEITTSYESTILHLDLDYAFIIAADHMPNLNSVDIFINQTYILTNDLYDELQESKSLTLTSKVIKEFLQKTSMKLESFSFRLDDCCWDDMKIMTDAGEAFLALGTMQKLKKLTISNVLFNDINVLTSCLNPRLKVLNLDFIKMSAVSWSALEVDVLVRKISQLTDLITLSLGDNALADEDLNIMLPNLTELKCLNVSGQFGDCKEDRHSLLTDKGLKAIANHCPNLQSLDVSYQNQGTILGVRVIVQHCSDLVVLQVPNLNVRAQDVHYIVTTLKKLLFFRFDNIVSGTPKHEHHILNNAMIATRGRTIVASDMGWMPVHLSKEHQKNREESVARMEKSGELHDNAEVYNVWDGV